MWAHVPRTNMHGSEPMSVCTQPLFRLSHVRHNVPLFVAVTRAYDKVRGFPPPARFKTPREATSVRSGRTRHIDASTSRQSWSRVHPYTYAATAFNCLTSTRHSTRRVALKGPARCSTATRNLQACHTLSVVGMAGSGKAEELEGRPCCTLR